MILVVVCDNLRSSYNVGSIFRISDALKVKTLYLCGITPNPENNFRKIQKTALGAIENVNWQLATNTWQVLEKLKKKGFFVIGVERTEKAMPFYKFKTKKQKLALVLGNEIKGLSKRILKRCHLVLEIPMEGIKESLNVAVAFGIIGYYLKYLS